MVVSLKLLRSLYNHELLILAKKLKSKRQKSQIHSTLLSIFFFALLIFLSPTLAFDANMANVVNLEKNSVR